MHSLRKASADALTIYGVGGDKMKAAGALDFMDLAHFHATGITAALRQIPNYRKAFAKIVANVQKVRPDVIVMIDNPGFNLHLAKKLHSLGFRLVYYVTPQIWAWAPKRIEKIKRYFAKCLVVFDFEETLFRKNGVPAVWVGHPLRDIPALIPGQHRHEARKAGPYTVALMPGSRRTEVAYLLPIYLEAAAALAGKLNGTRFLLLQSSTLL
jgi:lipid-A-disaccharide synthase